jgi:hypothetical protein
MNDKKELLDVFRKLDPVNQADMLAHIQVAYAAQENTKKYYKDPPECSGRQAAAGRGAGGVTA